MQNFLSTIVLRKGEIEEKEKGVSALRKKGETVKVRIIRAMIMVSPGG